MPLPDAEKIRTAALSSLEEFRTFSVSDTCQGQRIDQVISAQIPDLSRQRAQTLLRNAAVTLNGIVVLKPSRSVQPGDVVVVRIPPPQPTKVEPEDIPLTILYEDDFLAIIDKPPGLIVHPTGSIRSGTLVNALLHRFGSLSVIGGVMRPGIVHRLDRETSGLLIVAKQDSTHRALQDQFKARAIQKTYWAMVHGVPKVNSGTVDAPIGRHPGNPKRYAVRPEGKPAVTEWTLLKSRADVAWLEVHPRTGRTHQIRVHLRHIGFPILKDRMYGFRNSQLKGQWIDLLHEYPGILLHARSVGFTHPVSNDMMTFQTDPPQEFLRAIDWIKGLETE